MTHQKGKEKKYGQIPLVNGFLVDVLGLEREPVTEREWLIKSESKCSTFGEIKMIIL